MNNEALRVKWLSGAKGTVGIAKIKMFDGSIEYRISPVDGFLEHMDVQQIVAWGGSFPDEVGNVLFPEEA